MDKVVYYSQLEFVDPKPLRLFERRPTIAMEVSGLYANKRLARKAAEKKRLTIDDPWNWKPVVHKTYIELPERRYV